MKIIYISYQKKILKLNFSIFNFFTWKFPGILQNFLPKKPGLFPGINRVFSTLCNSTRKSRLSLKNNMLLYKFYIRPILTYGSVVYGVTAKVCFERIQIFQNKIIRRFTKAFRYIRNDVIHKDLIIRTFFDKIKHLAIKFHSCLSLVINPALNNVPNYDPNVRRNKKRPLAILTRPPNFVPSTKRWRGNTSGVAKFNAWFPL